VLRRSPGNWPGNQVWTGKTVPFGFGPVQHIELLCHYWVGTHTGHGPSALWPGLPVCSVSSCELRTLARIE
jgi:hypothetical protein